MSTQTERIAEARATWQRLERAAKEKDVASRKEARDLQDKFVAENGRLPMPGDEAFEQINGIRSEAREMVQQADNAKAQLEQLIDVQGAGSYSYEDVRGFRERSARGVVMERAGARFVGSEAYAKFQTLALRASSDEDVVPLGARVSLGQIMGRDEWMGLVGSPGMRATTVTGGGATQGAPLIQNDVQPGIVGYARKQPVMLSLVGTSPTDSDTVEYVRQTAVSTAAAEVAEDSAAAESAIAFETVTAAVKELAHFVPATRRALADAGQLQGIIEQDLLGGVVDRIDTQIASGNGSGENLTGIYNTSSIQTYAVAGSRLDAIQHAATLVEVAAGIYSEIDAIGFYPTDWEDLRLTKDSTGNYLFGPPSIPGPRTVFGYQAVKSTVFTAGTPLAGMFAQYATAWQREAPTIYVGYVNDDFTKRRLSILAEARLAFGVKRPTAFVTITGF